MDEPVPGYLSYTSGTYHFSSDRWGRKFKANLLSVRRYKYYTKVL